MDWILLYLLIGGFAGLLAGLLGVGGGLLIVPFLAWCFVEQGFNSAWIMHLAVGSSLATIVVTSISSVRAHHRRAAVRWDLFWLLLPGIVIGAFAGAQLARIVDTAFLRYLFASFELLVAIQMGFGIQPAAHRTVPGWRRSGAAGGVIGALSALVGIGGGTMTVPWLLWNRIAMHQAIGTSAAVGLPIAVAGAAGFVWAGWGQVGLPGWSSGFIYWPAFLGIAMMSVLTAPLGAHWAHQLPARRLKRLFALFLLGLALKMFWGLES